MCCSAYQFPRLSHVIKTRSPRVYSKPFAAPAPEQLVLALEDTPGARTVGDQVTVAIPKGTIIFPATKEVAIPGTSAKGPREVTVASAATSRRLVNRS